MKALVLALLLVANPATAAKLAFTVTSPAANNAQLDCALPPSLVAATDPVWIYVQVPALAVLDSSFVPRGFDWPRSYLGADSTKTYLIRTWAMRQLGSQRITGCSDSTLRLPQGANLPLPPAAPTFKP